MAVADHFHKYLGNGDDAFALVKGTKESYEVIDVIGDIAGDDPGSGWSVAGVSNATKEHTLIRKDFINRGNTDWLASTGTTPEDSEWIVFDKDVWQLGESKPTISEDLINGAYMQDSVVKLKAVPEEGWRFAGWNGALKSSFEEGSVVMASGKSVTAVFQAIPKYTLNTSTAGGGIISGNDSSPYYQGTEVTLVAQSDEGWQFIGWSGMPLARSRRRNLQ